ncbi:hypothetical protein AVEN_86371-1 [Araneus ventricosus]|uniref:Uncharacterized protein n=1 Tax=Araneus ventricosus TaxID=182803 RepID=A0A4Y2SJ42_ARAVE|nr:hypothetical protein AVEN_86371-1 [Araneus ventricosus]
MRRRLSDTFLLYCACADILGSLALTDVCLTIILLSVGQNSPRLLGSSGFISMLVIKMNPEEPREQARRRLHRRENHHEPNCDCAWCALIARQRRLAIQVALRRFRDEEAALPDGRRRARQSG